MKIFFAVLIAATAITMTLGGEAQVRNWSLSGNSGTDPSMDFVGTTDKQPILIKTGGVEAMRILPGGNVGIGTSSPGFKVEVNATHQQGMAIRGPFEGVGSGLKLEAGGQGGRAWELLATGRSAAQGPAKFNIRDLGDGSDDLTISPDGRVTVNVLEIRGGGDLAESFPTADVHPIQAGTVMVIDEQHPGSLRRSNVPYDRKVAGVISGAGDLVPGVTLQPHSGSGQIRIAMSGRVYIKAEAMANPIRPGDLLVTSSLEGYAMKSIDQDAAQGAVLGKAMSELNTGTGLVLALVTLQ